MSHRNSHQGAETMSDGMQRAIAKVDAELVEYRATVIEECARVAEREEFWDYLKPQAHIAAAIRALKDKP